MICIKCGRTIPDDALFCCYCGKKLIVAKGKAKSRGNGQGTVFRLPNGKYRAQVTLCYYLDDNGKRQRKTKSKTFTLKKDAVAALPAMLNSPVERKQRKTNLTLQQIYELWIPTHQASKSTIDNYRAAFRWFKDLWFTPMSDIDIDDLQECVDACPHGKRTAQNMKVCMGLIYKYAIPRKYLVSELNLAQYIRINSDDEVAHRESFTATEIEKIRKGVDSVPYADYVYCMIYLGFRPNEFLSLDISRYDRQRQAIVGGGKTEAGTNRTVTISPKIQAIISAIVGLRTTGKIFTDSNGNQFDLKVFTEKCFYPALEKCGIDNQLVEISGGILRHRLTPHSCRHTFATLMKDVQASDKDKLELIGHSSDEMLRYYQDVRIEDLRKITDAI